MPKPEQERAAQMLNALGHPVRVAMMHYIVANPGCICNDLVLRFGRAQATISQHLAILRRAELLETERDGQTTRYMANTIALGWLLGEIGELTDTAGQKR